MTWTISKLVKEYNIPRSNLVRIIKKHKKELNSHIKTGIRNRIELNDTGKKLLEEYMANSPDQQTTKRPSHDQVVNRSGEQVAQSQTNQLEKQLARKDQELDKKDEIINKLIETHAQDRERSAQDRERTDTIIMKMTNDLEQVRSEHRLLLEESQKKKQEPKQAEPKKTDRVISIQEFIAAKIEEDIEKSNYEAEKKRLKKQYDNPLQGRSTLYKIYVKMFRPDMLRQHAN